MRNLLLCFLIFISLTSCGVVPPTDSPTPTPAPTASATAAAPTQNVAPRSLRIWVTPRFDPATNALLQARLDVFAQKHTGLKIEVRVKEEASLVESLQLTEFAAPAAAPDLIALSRADLESAVAQGLIQPMDAVLFEQGNWHPLARSLGQVKGTVYGLPFALDALALATTSGEVLADWGAIANAGTLTFNVNDASIPLALYLAAGGTLADAEGRLTLDETALKRALTLFSGGNYLAVETDAEVAAAVVEGGFVAVGWSSNFLTGGQSNIRLDALPGLDGPSATLVTGWCWSITSTELERRELALELAEWLTAEGFLGEWTPSLGYLTPHQDPRWKPLLDPALALQTAALADAVSPILRDAVLAVLHGTSPEDAAREAVGKLK